jgi:putative nucleotidyltransferase with HDIG domain
MAPRDTTNDGLSRSLADSVVEELWFAEADARDDDTSASGSLAARLAATDGLRPTSAVAEKVFELFGDADYSLVAVARALEEDPALASRILRTANAPWFGVGAPVRSVKDAVVRVGSDTVSELVIATAVMDALRDTSGAGSRIRAHCAATAAMARVLALEFRPDCSDGMLLCGLFHDVGKLLLVQSGEFAYAGDAWAPHEALHGTHVAERDLLGFDHAVLGGHVLHRWNLPEPIPRVVAWHHQPLRAYAVGGHVGPSVAILRLAGHLEPIFRRKPQRYDEHVESVAETPEAVYLGLSTEALLGSWEPMFYAFHESTTVLGF